ncbi:hypothetical protein A9Q93_11810 [Nonlabens dokdonensis]|uniref:Uncharacterized protein n=1 Tax=Nonlabens dokdonensis TaxID=328515 RepID=A0A1Z8ALI1_9FLAO|nr:hypothetical protein [Nonlabens dokdonensis]OUS11153.1 hypothetical protein A9Q93_11810 [Nonlabens dokdonensis]
MQQGDTIIKEHLRIKKLDKLGNINAPWFREVSGVNESPTLFEKGEMASKSFTAVNFQNEFPTHIRYSLLNDTIIANVSNKSMSITYEFVKTVKN